MLNLARATAKRAGADLVLAGDPVEDPGGLPPVVATTVVSGSLLRRLAQSAGVRGGHARGRSSWSVSVLSSA